MVKRWYELLMDDHTMHEKVFAAMDVAFADPSGPSKETISGMLDYVTNYIDHCHSKKEEDHLFPLVQERGIPAEGGPLGVMLAEHEQQHDLVERLTKHADDFLAGNKEALASLKEGFDQYQTLCKDHFWKENDILYPMAIRVMTEADEALVIQGIEATETAMGDDTRDRYYALAETLADAGQVKDLSEDVDRSVMAAILNTLPVELSFVDADDRVQYFSHEDHDKIFPRSRSVVGMNVQNCHPPKSVHMVEAILKDFKAGKRDTAEFWIDFRDMKVFIRYFPVRDKAGKYLGCLEVTQDVTRIQGLKGQHRLLDD
ncbi:MAG: DUF438 domain-containing protein [Deltaproteobacteria bacterium]|nr:DUF438 domain-containing protein [Deltaproteobacteria bacterium]